jgi:hypothetical protein
LEEDEKAEDPEGQREQSSEKDGVEEEALVNLLVFSFLAVYNSGKSITAA